MRFFITGIGGFAGSHLAAHLLGGGHEVTGLVSRRVAHPRLEALAARYPAFDVAGLACADVASRAGLADAIAQARPDGVFHLAGIAFAPQASADPVRACGVNVAGTVHVLEAVRQAAPQARVVVAGSSDAYGAVAPDELPIREEVPLRPVSVYGVSKAAAEMAAFQQWWSSGLAVIRARAFNHTGPGQSPDFACSDFARQIAAIERGTVGAVLRVGNLAPVRDFSDVRDIVRGYAALWERGTPGEVYNLCSGVGTSLRAIVETLTAEARVRVEVAEEPVRLRGRELPTVVGDRGRAAALGWTPHIPLHETLRDLLDCWRNTLVRPS